MTVNSLLDTKLCQTFGGPVDQFAREHTMYGEIYRLEKLYNCEPLVLKREQPTSQAKVEKQPVLWFGLSLCDCFPAY